MGVEVKSSRTLIYIGVKSSLKLDLNIFILLFWFIVHGHLFQIVLSELPWILI